MQNAFGVKGESIWSDKSSGDRRLGAIRRNPDNVLARAEDADVEIPRGPEGVSGEEHPGDAGGCERETCLFGEVHILPFTGC